MRIRFRLLRWIFAWSGLLIALGSPLPSHGAGGDVLLLKYGGDAVAGKQEAAASAVDSEGNVIVTGYQNLGGGNDDYYTVKINAAGSVAWRATFDRAGGSDRAMAVAVDGNNDVIVTGYSGSGINSDIQTIKYKGNDGTVIWQHTFNGAAGGGDVGTSLAVDNLNNIYVGGNSQNGSGDDDYIIIKYGPDGPINDGPLWTATYNGLAGGRDRVTSIAAGNDGVVVTGSSAVSGTTFQIVTVKYDQDGTKKWEQPYSTGGTNTCLGKYVMLDGAGNVVITGSVANGIDLDIYTAKYNGTTGALIWQKTYNGGFDDEPNGMYIDSSNNVYITGYTWTVSGFNDFITIKYDGAAGTEQWHKIFDSGSGNSDVAIATGIVVDPGGDVFVTGYTITAGLYEFQTVKYKKDNGNQLWQSSFKGPDNQSAKPVGIGLSPAGEVLVAGWSDDIATGMDYYAIAYDPGLLNPPTSLAAQAASNTSVRLDWVRNSTNEDGFSIERCQGVGCENFAQVKTVGAGVTTYTDGSVTPLTSSTYYNYRVSAFNAANGYSHYSNTATALTVMVNSVAPAWNYIYNGQANRDDNAKAIAVGPDNNPVITGESNDYPPGTSSGTVSFNYFTVKLNRTNASAIWSAGYNDENDASDTATCVAVDGTNKVTVSGYAYLYNGHSGDVNSLYTIGYPAGGPPETWNDQYNGPVASGATDDRAVAITSATDASNNVVVVGYGKNAAGNDDIYVIKYGPTGTRLWASTPYDGGGNDYPAAVALASDGSVYVTGRSGRTSDAKNNFFTARYNGATGSRIWTDVYSVTAGGDNGGNSIAIDAAGDVYVAGAATNSAGNTDIYTIKYSGASPSAQRVWEKSKDGTAHGDDAGVAVRIDPVDGAVVVAGTTLSGAGDHDFTVIRYSPTGDVVWPKTYQKPSSDDTVTAMAIDSNGYIFVTGNTGSGLASDSLTVKYDYLGNIISSTLYHGSGFTESEALAINSLDEAFVAGYTENGSGNKDYLVYKIALDTTLPYMPYGITATAGYVNVTLNWSDRSTSKDGYRLARKVGACSQANNNEWSDLGTVPSTSYSESGLNISSSYCYRIQTYQNGGAASRWTESTVTTLSPPAPTIGTATIDSTTQITVKWTDTTNGENGFKIFRCSGAGCTDFATTPIGTASANAMSFPDTTVTNGITYRYKVTAFGAGWESAYSALTPNLTPVVANAPVATATHVSETQINLGWTDSNGDESGFRIFRCSYTSPAVDCTDFTQLGSDKAAGVTSLVGGDTGLTSNYTYKYKVQAFKTAAGTNDWTRDSAIVSANTIPTAPTIGTATIDSTTQITVKWTDTTTTESGFTVERCTGANCTTGFTPLTPDAGAGAGSGTTISYPDSTVQTGVTYRYQVKAVGAWGSSAYSALTPNLTPVVANAPVATATRISETQINLGWTDTNGDESGFRIFHCSYTSPAVDCTDFTQLGSDKAAGVTSLVGGDTGLTSNYTYKYKVQAFKTAAGTNDWTRDSAIVSANTIPTAPTIGTATIDSTTQITVKWTDTTTTESGFTVERCTGANCTTGFTVLTPNATAGAGSGTTISYPDSTVQTGVTYRYQVKAVGAWGSSAYSALTPNLTPVVANAPVATATRISETQINLGWTDTNGDESGFRIFRCSYTSPAVDCTDFTQLGSDKAAGTTSLVGGDTGLASNYTYKYKVQAFKTATPGTNDWTRDSAIVSANTIPTAPTIGTATIDSTTQITVKWTDTTTTESGFTVERCTGTNCTTGFTPLTPDAGAGTGSGTTISYPDSTVQAGLTYRYQVKAVGAWGSSAYSALTPNLTATVANAPVATATHVSETQINLGWTDTNGDESGFRVFRCSYTSPAVDCTDFTQLGSDKAAGTTSLVGGDTGLTTNYTYKYKVQAFKTATPGTNDWTRDSAIVSANTIPTAPTIGTATIDSTTQITVKWTDTTTTESGFTVERCEGSGCTTFTPLTPDAGAGAGSGTTNSYPDSTVQAGHIYRYQVKAIGTWGSSAYSAITPNLTATVANAPVATATHVSETQINLGWTDTNGDESGFRVFRCSYTSPAVDCTDFTQLGSDKAAGTTSLVGGDTGLTTNYTYKYKVQAFKTATPGTNDWTRDSAIVSANTIPTAPTIGTATIDSTTQITVKWTDTTTTESGFVVERCTGANCTTGFTPLTPNATAGTGSGTTISYPDSTVQAGLTYRYQVKAVGAWGSSAYSALTPNLTATVANAPVATATRVTETQISLSWTDTNGDESGFRVFRCSYTSPAVDCTDFTQLGSDKAAGATSLVGGDTGLNPNYTYKYKVQAFKTATPGTNDWTRDSSIVSVSMTPNPPSNLTASVVSSGQVNLAWKDNTASESGFVIQRCDGSSTCTNFTDLITLGSNATADDSYSDMTVLPETIYRYQVRATNSTVPWDSVYSNISLPATTPSQKAPTGLTSTSTLATKVSLRWTDNTLDETGFVLQRCIGSSCSDSDFANLATPGPNSTSYVTYDDLTVCNGITYTYRVRATRNIAPVYDTTYSTYTVTPTAASPVITTTTRVSEAQINLVWTDTNTDKDGFRVERCNAATCNDGDFTQISGDLANTATSFPDTTGLFPNHTYTYRVKAFNNTHAGCGWVQPSIGVSKTTTVDAPTGLTATQAGMSQINLSWSDTNTTETGFRIERCTGSGCTNFAEIAQTTTPGSTGITWSDNTVVGGTTYRYQIRATKSTTPFAWDSGYSIIASATTQSAPDAPTTLSAQNDSVNSANQINLTWNDTAADATGYRIESCSGTNCTNFTEIGTAAAKSYSNMGLSPLTTYCYRVRGYKSGVWTSGYSVTTTASCATTAPDSPTSLSATAVNSMMVRLIWNDSSADVNGFNLEAQIWNGEWVLVKSLGATETSYTDTVGIEPLKTYNYRIKAFKGAQSSSYSNQATVTTPAFTGPDTDTTCVVTDNNAPAITSSPLTTVSEGGNYSYQVIAAAKGGRTPLSYSLASKPSGMTISAAGLVNWAPGYSQGGNQNVTVRVIDSGGHIADQNFSIIVGNVNNPPVFTSIDVVTAVENHLYSYQVTASDPEGDSLTFTPISVPTGMTITTSGLITWTPTPAQFGDNNVVVQVTDGALNTQKSFKVNVTHNQAPFFTSTPTSTLVTTGMEGAPYSYQVQASDPDGDPITYTLTNPPAGMEITSGGLVTWTPTFIQAQAGTADVSIRVSDGSLSADQSYTITLSQNHLPVITSTPGTTTASEGVAYSYQVVAYAPVSGDTLTYSLTAAPTGMTINSSGLVSWTPSTGQGSAAIPVTVSVQAGASSANTTVQSFTIAVPYISMPTQQRASVTVPYSYTVTANKLWATGTPAYSLTSPILPTTSINSVSGVISWTPAAGQTGNIPVTVKATIGTVYATQTFNIAVPSINTTPAPTMAAAGVPYSYQVTAVDPAGGTFNYSPVTLPTGMTISSSGLISWTPTAAQVGNNTATVKSTVNGTSVYATQALTIPVLAITSNAVTTALSGMPYNYTVTANPAAGTAITLTNSPPAWLGINAGVISGTPPANGSYPVTVTATNGSATTTQTYNITAVAPPPAPSAPTLSAQGGLSGTCSVTHTFSWNAVAPQDANPVWYNVQLDTVNTFNSLNLQQSGWQAGTSWQNVLGSSAQTWYWRVQAEDSGYPQLVSTSSTLSFTEGAISWDCNCDNSCQASSCPLVFTWNGTNFGYESDLFGPMIAQTKKGPGNIPLFHPSYITLDELVPDDNNRYRLNIWESLNEATLMDEVKLMVVDYPEGYEITSSDVENTYYFGYVTPFKIITIKDPVSPVTATDKHGVDVLASVLEVDDNTAPMDPADPDNYYTFDYGTIQHPENAKLLIDSWLVINSKLYKSTALIQPYLEVVDANGNWVKVKSIGLPSGDLKRMVIDISNIFLTSDLRIRLHLGSRKSHIWVIDKIQLDDSAPVNVTIQELPVASANLQFGGQIIQAMNTQLHRMQVSDQVLPTRTDYFGYGNFTRYGDVINLLTQRDDKYVIMNYADKLDLTFDGLPAPQPGMTRGFILKADYYFKELKGYLYLDPLPFHGMSDYPPPVPEAYPTDDDHNQYRQLYNTRVVAP